MSARSMQYAMAPDARRGFRAALLRWYRRSHRLLPWRAEGGARPDPYHVLVSEAMLQQTQAATVVGYFNRFIEAWPTVRSLASEDEQNVLRLWQGLGYYRRARLLHAAAKRIVADHGGRVPDTVEQLLALPGVGRYTAGAVASIAYGRRAAIVDGNVSRVLGRVLAIEQPIHLPASQAALWREAGEMAACRSPGDVNQAMMELGATVCTPRSPSCDACPVRRWCGALAKGLVERLPMSGRRAKVLSVSHRMVAVRRGGRWLIEQRGEGGLWAGMWQLPTRESSPGENGQAASPSALRRWFADRFGLTISPPARMMEFNHATTHRRITFELWCAEVTAGRLRPNRGEWRSLDDLAALPMSNPQRRAIDLLRRSLVC